jgi:hypothetical protein
MSAYSRFLWRRRRHSSLSILFALISNGNLVSLPPPPLRGIFFVAVTLLLTKNHRKDLVDLKNPPKDYPFPPFDLLGHLSTIRQNLVDNKYKNEMAFQEDLYKISLASHDGHLSFYPDGLTKVFDFVGPFGLVSYAKDPLSFASIKIFGEKSIPVCVRLWRLLRSNTSAAR